MSTNNLLTRPDGRKISFSTHLFLYISLMFGLAFVLPPEVLSMGTSPLYAFTANSATWWSLAWGLALLVVSILNTVMVLTRNRLLSSIVGCAGFMLWLWAAFAYVSMGFWFGLLVGALPNVAFWAWYSLTVSQFRR